MQSVPKNQPTPRPPSPAARFSPPVRPQDRGLPIPPGTRSRLGMYPHVSRAEVAEKTGRTLSGVSYILSGSRGIPLPSLPAFAEACGVSPTQFLEDWKLQHSEFERRKKRARERAREQARKSAR